MNDFITHLGLTMDAVKGRRDRLAMLLQWGLVAVVGIIIAPLAFSLLAGFAALLLTATIAAAVVAFAPVASMKLANRRMSAFLAEASAHPMPTLENELLRRQVALGLASARLRTSLAQVAGFVEQADVAARRYPDAAERWRERATKAQALSVSKKRAYRRACESLDEFEQVVERCRVEWGLAEAEAAVNESLRDALGDSTNALGATAAIEAVTLRMNEAFAGLDVSLLEETEGRPEAGAVVDPRSTLPDRTGLTRG